MTREIYNQYVVGVSVFGDIIKRFSDVLFCRLPLSVRSQDGDVRPVLAKQPLCCQSQRVANVNGVFGWVAQVQTIIIIRGGAGSDGEESLGFYILWLSLPHEGKAARTD